jgi:uncharacterized protein DUF3142
LTPHRKILDYVAAAALGCAALAISSRTHAVFARAHTNSVPAVIFWAWERPEDLRFLDSQRAGVAFLAKTIYLPPRDSNPEATPARIVVRPRLQPLLTAPGTALIAVVRIETPSTKRSAFPSAVPHITSEIRETIADEIASLQNIPSIRAIQIDFDASTSQHNFYSALLQDVRGKLRPDISLSITALASWCIGDPWLAQLPAGTIDEAVPMLFRMGPDTANVAKFLNSGENFRVAACQNALGVSTDEPISLQLLTRRFPGMPANWREKRIYVFAPRAWTPSAADSVLQEWKQ